MPKMGESIEEATITRWFVKEGDKVEEDDVLLEIATDKVDSEIPSPVEGFVKKIMYQQDETVAVGSVIAVIDTEAGSAASEETTEAVEEGSAQKEMLVEEEPVPGPLPEEVPSATEPVTTEAPAAGRPEQQQVDAPALKGSGDRFYSPLVRKIAGEENITQDELDSIPGSGLNGRVQKKDILDLSLQGVRGHNKKNSHGHPPEKSLAWPNPFRKNRKPLCLFPPRMRSSKWTGCGNSLPNI